MMSGLQNSGRSCRPNRTSCTNLCSVKLSVDFGHSTAAEIEISAGCIALRLERCAGSFMKPPGQDKDRCVEIQDREHNSRNPAADRPSVTFSHQDWVRGSIAS